MRLLPCPLQAGCVNLSLTHCLLLHAAYCDLLVELCVNGNRLRALPEEIGALTRLRTLEVRKNRLTRLPATLPRLAALTLLDCRENGICETPQLPTTTCLSQLFLGACSPHCSARRAARFRFFPSS